MPKSFKYFHPLRPHVHTAMKRREPRHRHRAANTGGHGSGFFFRPISELSILETRLRATERGTKTRRPRETVETSPTRLRVMQYESLSTVVFGGFDLISLRSFDITLRPRQASSYSYSTCFRSFLQEPESPAVGRSLPSCLRLKAFTHTIKSSLDPQPASFPIDCGSQIEEQTAETN